MRHRSSGNRPWPTSELLTTTSTRSGTTVLPDAASSNQSERGEQPHSSKGSLLQPAAPGSPRTEVRTAPVRLQNRFTRELLGELDE